jgi:hypothetical protein
MIVDEKLDKVCKDFSSLSGEKQDYILGILQALVFANSLSAPAKHELSSDENAASKPLAK